MPKSTLGLIVQHENGSLVSDYYGSVIVFMDMADASKYLLKGSRTLKAVRYARPRGKKKEGDNLDISDHM